MFSLDRKELLSYLKVFRKFVDKKSTIPILQNILFEWYDDGFLIKASNLDIEMTVKIHADDPQKDFTVNLEELYNIVNKSKEKIINFELKEEEKISVNGYILNTLPPFDFPLMRKFEENVSNVIDTNIFNDVVPFASKEETRYYLRGVFVDNENLTATCGDMLATKPHGFKNEMKSVIIPNDALKTIAAAFGENTVFSVQNDGVKSKFEKDKISLITKNIDGTYPDYKRVLPKNTDQTVIFKREDLINVLDKCTVQPEKGIKLFFTKNNCKFKGLNFEFDVICQNENDFNYIFDQFYLSKIMKFVKNDDVEMKFDFTSKSWGKLKIGDYILMAIKNV